ncbi:MAG TPA: hypothetical protein VEC17_03300 [Candidatus Binatia bacterium]|nr:hypothetical protein [Candidatus Binatia bacterium]
MTASREERVKKADRADCNDSELTTYEHHLGFKLSDLKGKKVLDIGGTMGGNLYYEAKAEEVDIVILSASNVYGSCAGPNVLGLAQELPFLDNSFDIELSLGVLPFLPESTEEYEVTFLESIRTCRVGGRTMFFPVLPRMNQSAEFKRAIQNVSDHAGVILEVVDFSDWSFQPEDEEGNPEILHRLILVKK